ncbi:hypothetical protein [Ruegeria sp. HKCCA5491]|uniref:hypothetical protein n=1 Tax=Ruegeria sp. HKCCA5491 TaxID=2682986 RepID=UPI001489E38C|nr:hypothetical protein [Ruegeria sp. HKCCA5491]
MGLIIVTHRAGSDNGKLERTVNFRRIRMVFAQHPAEEKTIIEGTEICANGAKIAIMSALIQLKTSQF